MSFAQFQRAVRLIGGKAGVEPIISEDRERGMYIARFPGICTVTGNSTSRRITVRWRNGRTSVRDL